MNSKRVFYRHLEDKSHNITVNRSSAIFYFICGSGTNTYIHFLNYWQIKRGIAEVNISITVREMDGTKMFEQEVPLPEKGSVEINVAEVLHRKGYNQNKMCGSIELQILSATNLFIAYPAAVVRYKSKDWHTTAHSSQRIFSELSGDKNFGQLIFAEEGNQTIQENLNLEPFFIIHNGGSRHDDEQAFLEVITDLGKRIKLKLPKLEWHPFETKHFYLKDLVEYREILNGRTGTYRLGYHISGVFPRLVAGFENTETGSWSIDHTNFAATSGPAIEDHFSVNHQKEFKNLVLNVPTTQDKKWQCYVDIYPTYPNDDYQVKITGGNGFSDEQKLINLPNIEEAGITRIPLANEDATEISFAAKEKLPRRFHLGIHYQYNDSDPAFIITGPVPWEDSPSVTKWSPLFGDSKNYLFIASRYVGDEQPESVQFSGRIYNSFAAEPLQFDFNLAATEAKVIALEEEIPELSTFLTNKSGWIYMKSDKPSKTVLNYVSVYNEHSLACDHVF